LSREILTLQARFALADGDFVVVQRWIIGLDRSGEQPFPFVTERETLLLARWQLAQDRRETALQLLQDLLREAQKAGRRRSAFEAQVLLALVYAADEQLEQARHVLLTLLGQTCAEGYLRLFLDEGEAMEALLRSLAPHIREQPLLAYLQSIIRAFPGSQASSPTTLLIEPLSLQELRVLRLLVPGHSNAEIARKLVVSVNTVRTHIQNIYRKLDAHNRAAAIELARQLHLIS
jgi:LuxR family maltose regulon positive regulatory protein